jgi:hypothetical protein
MWGVIYRWGSACSAAAQGDTSSSLGESDSPRLCHLLCATGNHKCHKEHSENATDGNLMHAIVLNSCTCFSYLLRLHPEEKRSNDGAQHSQK